MAELEVPSVTITKHRVELDPPVYVFNVVLESGGGSWQETWATKAELYAFLRGIRATCGMLGLFFSEPGIPQEITSTLEEKRPHLNFIQRPRQGLPWPGSPSLCSGTAMALRALHASLWLVGKCT